MSDQTANEVPQRRRMSIQNSLTTCTARYRSSSASVQSNKLSSSEESVSSTSNRKQPIYLLSQKVHSAQDSLFSTSSGWTDYRGFFNLALLLLVISNARVALENLIKYGILISPLEWMCNSSAWHASFREWPNLTIVLASNATILCAFGLEKLLDRRYISDALAFVCYSLFIFLHTTIPAIIVLRSKSNPLFSSLSLFVIVIQVLKIVSYGHVNYWCRMSRNMVKESGKGSSMVDYPRNLTLSNLYYFMLAPTLCYELSYPKTASIRRSFLVKRSIELVSFTFVSVALCQQWVIPLVKNSLAPFSEMDIKRCVERVLKLAVPNHLIWLMFFYLIFHSGLNLIAELMCFADRKFYMDFWNSETISGFWKAWNIPVHRWALRHVYKPMLRNGYSRTLSSLAVFSISAFFHEYLVSVPLNMFRLWACYGMLAQIPLSLITDKYLKGGHAGNIVVWLSLILGQPMAILMYVHDWYLLHYPGHNRLQVVPMGIPHI